MRRILVAIFDSEPKAYEGSRILRELDGDASIELDGLTVLAKDAGGKVSVKESTDPEAPGTAAGLLAGTLIGLFTGPVGLAIAAGGGTIAGALFDLARVGVGLDFVDEIARALEPGKFAVVADVWEEWMTPVDARLEAAGATIYRRPRAEVLDAQIEREVAAFEAELASVRAEMARATGREKAKLQAKLDAVKAQLHATEERTRIALASLKTETEATLARVQSKAAKARDEKKAKLEARAAAMRADLVRRGERLDRAWVLIKEALKP